MGLILRTAPDARRLAAQVSATGTSETMRQFFFDELVYMRLIEENPGHRSARTQPERSEERRRGRTLRLDPFVALM
jgi:hypothetical protein